MTYENPRDQRDTRVYPNTAPGISIFMPIIGAAVIVILLLWAFVGRNTTTGLNDTTNAGPSAQTVTPAPSPSASPPVPTPNPTTEPRPTQAP